MNQILEFTKYTGILQNSNVCMYVCMYVQYVYCIFLVKCYTSNSDFLLLVAAMHAKISIWL